jgi:hypothetical protein
MRTDHYDVIIIIIIGSAPAVARSPTASPGSGKRTLILPRERENWSAEAVFGEERYKARETWHNKDGRPPALSRYSLRVGGNTKDVRRGAAATARAGFRTVRHADGVSPAWPL